MTGGLRVVLAVEVSHEDGHHEEESDEEGDDNELHNSGGVFLIKVVTTIGCINIKCTQNEKKLHIVAYIGGVEGVRSAD
jgi:hypothetical protein